MAAPALILTLIRYTTFINTNKTNGPFNKVTYLVNADGSFLGVLLPTEVVFNSKTVITVTVTQIGNSIC